MSVIAEIKKASPSKGLLCPDLDPCRLAGSYAAGGAAALSVITEQDFFLGDPEHLSRVVEAVDLPVLRKDFIIDPVQVSETAALGADALLLIAAILDKERLGELLSLTWELGMEALVEVHDEAEVQVALDVGANIIGINNRDLKTFQTDLNTTARLTSLVPPDRILVSESGIRSRRDVLFLENLGVYALLVGEELVRSRDPEERLRQLRGVSAEIPDSGPVSGARGKVS